MISRRGAYGACALCVLITIFSASRIRGAETAAFAAGRPARERASAGKKAGEGADEYRRIADGADRTVRGMFTLYHTGKRLYMEIPRAMTGRPMLLAGRVSAVSDNEDVTAGMMPGEPVVVEWVLEGDELLLRKVNTAQSYDPGEDIAPGIRRNSINPLLEAFGIAAYGPDSASVVIDPTDYLIQDREPFTPIPPADGFAALFGLGAGGGDFRPDLSGVVGVAAYPGNVNVRTRMAFGSDGGSSFTAEMTVSLLLLPDSVMRPRIADPAVGLFSESRKRFTAERGYQKNVSYITRWELKPAPEDEEKFLRGEPVEPQDPIVFYIDPAFPRQWRPWLKEGVEDWQAAFERIGFRNAIVARDYPDDEDFDPDDIRYTCLVYSPSMTANAMGPSWTDPRSGRILQASVYFYHNIVGLLHDWRFVQTAAADPEARAENYDMDILGPMLRYVVAHEVGHTLGLKHNMRGSYAYPVDSLRSAAFTAARGTTASIMDYARFNYVAQPGDGVTHFLPPRLGPYDMFAIEWAYRPIPQAATPADEVPVLKSWIREHSGSPEYLYGAQTFSGDPDPAAQAEALGDDAVAAGRYGIRNLRVIADNLLKWTAREGEGYGRTARLRKEMLRQFGRYIGHAQAFLGGVFRYEARAGDGRRAVEAVGSGSQREALRFVWENLTWLPGWFLNGELDGAAGPMAAEVAERQTAGVAALVSRRLMSRVEAAAAYSSDPYPAARYMEDLYRAAWAPGSYAGAEPEVRRRMQAAFVQAVIDQFKRNGRDDVPPYMLFGVESYAEGEPPCAYRDYADALREGGFGPGAIKDKQTAAELSSVYYDCLLKIRRSASSRIGSYSADDDRHYRYVVYIIDSALKG